LFDPREQLEAIAAAIGSADDEALANDPGVALMREGLERRREMLIGAVRGSLDLVLSRNPARGVGSEVPLVASALGELQESLASIAQSVAGRTTSRGVIQGDIAEGVELRIAAAAPGSLELTLVPSDQSTTSQEALFEEGGESLLEVSVARFFDVVESASRNRDALLESVAELGPRATGHIVAFTKALADAEAAAALSWQTERATLQAEMSNEVASQVFQLLNEAEEIEDHISVAGRIVGGSLLHKTFELERDDHSVLTGKVDESLLPELERLFGHRVEAMLDMQQLRLKTGETKNVYRMTGLRPEPEPIRA
jgi:hypothetical protein